MQKNSKPSMQKISVYRCDFCGKIFKINRHFCFKDPSNKACASCEFYGGAEKIQFEDGSIFHSYICKHNGDILEISNTYDEYSGNIPLNKKRGYRKYDCDWWELRKDLVDKFSLKK